MHQPDGKPDSASSDGRPSLIVFPPFQLDRVEQRLWRGQTLIPVKPKTLAILLYMLERPGRLVTKQELLAQLWGGVQVSESVLKTHFGEIRRALGDRAKDPRYIETAHALGYRFIGRIKPAAPSSSPSVVARPPQRRPSGKRASSPASHFVGREAELRLLRRQLARAVAGERQVTFVKGEPGIGKTTLVNAFLAELSRDKLWVAWGQCINQYGAGEPYLPISEALRRLCRQPGAELVVSSLRRSASPWLPQMLGLSEPSTELVRTPSVPGLNLRELTEALETLTEQRPLVLLLEDLHWADHSTLDLVAYAAQRSDAARLFILATYRPLEALSPQHRLASVHHDLKLHDRCMEIALPHLTQHAVTEYLAGRFVEGPLPAGLPELIHRRSQGNALFMVRIIDAWLEQGLLIRQHGGCTLRAPLDELAHGVPDTVVRSIEYEIDRLTAFERSVLEAASAAGNEFSTATVAAALLDDLIRVEELCRDWARRGQFLRAHGQSQWNDGTVSERCSFSHVLYHQVVYERIGAARRAQLHRRIGERLEAGHAGAARQIAAELAVHFQHGQDLARAVQYLRLAGEQALHKGAHHEAVDHFSRALELLSRLPASSATAQIELELCVYLGALLAVTKGYGEPEVKHTYARAMELCQTLPETPQLFPIMSGIAAFHMLRGAYRTALELGKNLLDLAEHHRDAVARAEASLIIGVALHHLGEHAGSKAHLERARDLSNATQHDLYLRLYGHDPGVFSRCFLAVISCVLGYPDQAKRIAAEALLVAHELADGVGRALALSVTAIVHHFRREPEASCQAADALAASSRELGLPFYRALATLMKGAAWGQLGKPAEGARLLELGWAELISTGAVAYGTHWATLTAEAYGRIGKTDQGLQLLDRALSEEDRDEERIWDAERHRARAELLIKARASTPEVMAATRGLPSSPGIEACLLKAIEVARQQRAKLFELRAAISLYKYWREAGKAAEGRALLTDVYGWFTEGFETWDLKEAKALNQGSPTMSHTSLSAGRGSHDLSHGPERLRLMKMNPNVPELSNAALTQDVAAAVRGDRPALERVVRAVQPLFGRLALRFFGCPAHAEDATQEALAQLVTKLDRFEGESAFTTWAYRVATNKFLSIARSPAEREALSFDAFDEELASPVESTGEPATQVEHELLIAEVRIGCTLAMLLCLDREARMAYVLGAIAELDHQTAAEILGCSAATYRKRLERARDAITALMRRRCGVFDADNACQCGARISVATERGRLDPRQLLFASSAEQVRRFPEVLHQIRGLTEVRRAAAIYQSHPDPSSRDDFALRLDEILGSGTGLPGQG